jgi:endogenous inhibitor of DNA gyrase (YacG/DUF329 family)
MMTMSNTKKIQCPQCEEIFDNENDLVKHGISEHGVTGIQPRYYPESPRIENFVEELKEGEGMELADETYIKQCSNCGGKIIKPIFYKGYVFCSSECKNAFLEAKEGPIMER